MSDEAHITIRRIEACVLQAKVQAQLQNKDEATAAGDLMCAFVLIARMNGADPEEALKAMWENAKLTVDHFWDFRRAH